MGILFSILYFGGFVPRYFIFRFFRGTFSSFSYIMFHIFLTFWWSRTPIFHFSLFSGCISVFLIHYVSYFPCFLVVVYPDISFFRFFRGTRLLVHHLLCLQHTPLCPKRTTIFHFLYFSGYAPPHTSLIVTSAHSYSPKTYPAISFLTFLWVRYSIA